ncbi:hypothetical protein [Vreelandella profundi]|uniref:hypothetical protein n=1 Tax=Vreelandella profundi TaxID=2852117 RepID=UPI001F38E753|nr:hypothetical protein [Halomonas profundi]
MPTSPFDPANEPLGSSNALVRDLNSKNLDIAVQKLYGTWFDRFGLERPTIAAAIDPTGLVQTAVNAKSAAERAADSASASAAAAAADGSYASTAAGLAATTSGDVFLVATANPNEFLMYENASGAAVARGPFTVAAAAVAENAKRARARVIGRVSTITYDLAGVPTVTIADPGYIYGQNNSGLPLATIAPVSEEITLGTSNGLIADMDNGPFDGQGRIIPQVANIASIAGSGWQSGNKFILLAASDAVSDRALTGAYDISHASSRLGNENSLHARTVVQGTYRIERVQAISSWIVSLGEGNIYREDQTTFRIAPLDSATIQGGRGVFANLDSGPFDEFGRIIPQIEKLPGATGWQSGEKFLLFSLGYRGTTGGPAEDREFTIQGEYSNGEAGPFDCEVAWNQRESDPLPSWDEATRTLTWSDTFMLINGSVSRVLLQAGSLVIPSGGFWVAVLDTKELDRLTTNPTLPSSAVVPKTYGAGDDRWGAEPGRYIPLFVVGLKSSYPVRFQPVIGSTAFPSSAPSGGGKPMNLLISNDGASEIRIVLPGANPETNGAVEVVYAHALNPEKGADVWRITGIYDTTRNGNTLSRVRSICNPGEIEMAIKITDKGDHIGGSAHGDEIKEYVTMLVNGVSTPMDVAGAYQADTVEFLQKSRLFEPDTTVPQSNHIATSWKRVVFSTEGVEINNRIEWLQSFQLDQCFLSMLTVLRDAANSEVLKISDKGYRAPYWEEEAVGNPDHDQIHTDTPHIKLSGPSGYAVEMEILKGWDKPNREAYISSAAQYNKIYFNFTGWEYVTEVGEVMSIKSRFRVQNSN